MLPRRDAGNADRRGGSISQQLGERPRVLMSNHGGDRPGSQCVFGRKGCTTPAETPPPVVGFRTRALRDQLQNFGCDASIHQRLASQNSGLAVMIAFADPSPYIKASRRAQQGEGAGIGEISAVLEPLGRVGYVLHDVAVRGYQSRGNCSKWQQPVSIPLPQPQGAQPNFLLIGREVLQHRYG